MIERYWFKDSTIPSFSSLDVTFGFSFNSFLSDVGGGF